jgi:putative DNA primase/helicase
MSNNEETQTNKSNVIEIPLDMWVDIRNKTLEHTQKEVDRALQQDQELQAIKDGEPTSKYLEFEDGKVKYDHVGQAKEIIRELRIMHNKFGMWYYNKKTGLWSKDTIPVAKNLIQQKLGKYFNSKRLNETIQVINSIYDENCGTIPFDQQINLIPFRNGVYDLHTKNFRGYRHSDYLTTSLPHDYNSEAIFEGSKTDRYLTKLLGDKKQFFLEWIGYTFYRAYSFQFVLILKGNGHNGKSVLIEWYSQLIGGQNVSNVPLKELQENRFMKAVLYKKYANVFADIGDDYFRYAEMLKALTGNDTIDCDQKNQGELKFKNYAKLMFSANTLPSFRDKTEGLVRRFLILPMVTKMPVSKVDFMQVLLQPIEVQGVIYAALKAFEKVLDSREFSFTEDMHQSKADWLDNMDYVRSFVEGECLVSQDKWIYTDNLFHAYKRYCDDSEVAPLGKKKFFEHLQQTFPQIAISRKTETNGKKPYIFKGITIE